MTGISLSIYKINNKLRGLGIARIEKSSIEWDEKDRFGNGRISRRKGGPTLKQRCTYINKETGYGLDRAPSHLS